MSGGCSKNKNRHSSAKNGKAFVTRYHRTPTRYLVKLIISYPDKLNFLSWVTIPRHARKL